MLFLDGILFYGVGDEEMDTNQGSLYIYNMYYNSVCLCVCMCVVGTKYCQANLDWWKKEMVSCLYL